MKKTRRVTLSVSWLAELGLSRHAAYRGLKALEDRGLVVVDRHRGRKPLVTVIERHSDIVSSSSAADLESEHAGGFGRDG
jgi:predicted ArsR family transcriptional regulator